MASLLAVGRDARRFIVENLPFSVTRRYESHLSDFILQLTEEDEARRLSDNALALQHLFLRARDTDLWMDKKIQIQKPVNVEQKLLR